MSDLSVSCVIPTHGRPQYLREALDSVFAQTLLPLEIIIVSDDGNTDSEAVARSYEGREVPVVFLQNHDAPGASGSRNLGACHAHSEWLAFLDDDDMWAPDFLRHSGEIFGATHANLIVSWLKMFRADRQTDGVNIRPNLTARDAGARTPGLTGSNFVIHRAAFEALGGFDPSLPVLNDIDFMYRYLLAGGTYAVNTNFDMLQRRHGEGQLTKPTMMRADGVRKYIAKHRATLRLTDVRHLRFVEHRTRYNAATAPKDKVKNLILGVLNAAPADVVESVSNWRKRDIWH